MENYMNTTQKIKVCYFSVLGKKQWPFHKVVAGKTMAQVALGI